MRYQLVVSLLALAAAAGAQEDQARPPAYLGVGVADLRPEVRREHKIDPAVKNGVVLTEVAAGSPAARAGWRAGDVVVKFGGKPVRTTEEMIAAMRARFAGDKVTYEINRRGGAMAGELVLRARPKERPALDRRLDGIQREIEALRRRVDEKARAAKPPRTLAGWIEREEKALGAARRRGDQARVHWHAIRLSLLREMRAAAK